MLCPTPPESLVDREGRPYFLWDCELTLEEFKKRLTHPDEDSGRISLGASDNA